MNFLCVHGLETRNPGRRQPVGARTGLSKGACVATGRAHCFRTQHLGSGVHAEGACFLGGDSSMRGLHGLHVAHGTCLCATGLPLESVSGFWYLYLRKVQMYQKVKKPQRSIFQLSHLCLNIQATCGHGSESRQVNGRLVCLCRAWQRQTRKAAAAKKRVFRLQVNGRSLLSKKKHPAQAVPGLEADGVRDAACFRQRPHPVQALGSDCGQLACVCRKKGRPALSEARCPSRLLVCQTRTCKNAGRGQNACRRCIGPRARHSLLHPRADLQAGCGAVLPCTFWFNGARASPGFNAAQAPARAGGR